MITLTKEDNLILTYHSDNEEWVDKSIEENGYVKLCKGVFTFSEEHIVCFDDLSNNFFTSDKKFRLGILHGDYYEIDKEILDLKHNLLLYKKMSITKKTFCAAYNISIFSKIDALINEPIIIGGNHEGAISEEDFYALQQSFPTYTELKKYSNYRISAHIKNYFKTMEDSESKYKSYISKKDNYVINDYSTPKEIKEYELKKFQFVEKKLQDMLINSEYYIEKVWQKNIVDIILLLFPKYIMLLENVAIEDFYSNPKKVKNRFIDFVLLDSNGSMDIIEIKRPFEEHILSNGKYRDNYTPHRELSGAVMQIEKYLFHLNKWGKRGEDKLVKNRRRELPEDFNINITNPKGLIILGRDKDFSLEQKFDFELIRRKYSRIADIVTYDDLLRRLKNTIAILQHDINKKKEDF